MRETCRHALILTTAVVLVLIASGSAFADVSLTYQGETTDRTSYSGSNSSDELWDYVYDLSGFDPFLGPSHWAIFVSYQVDSGDIFDPTGWSGSWDSQITTGEYGSIFDTTDLIGQSAVVWENTDLFTHSETGFHYRNFYAPYPREWYGRGGINTGEGYEYTAAPEPTTLLLTSLGLAGLAAWRRRRTV